MPKTVSAHENPANTEAIGDSSATVLERRRTLYFSQEALSHVAVWPLDTWSVNKCFVVVDGMGGYHGGEMAANITASSFTSESESWNISAESAKGKITRILETASREISEAVKINPQYSSMGAAFTVFQRRLQVSLFLKALYLLQVLLLSVRETVHKTVF